MIDLNPVPAYQWTHREFTGPDPWSNDRPVRWSVVVYRMASEAVANVVRATKRTVPAESNDVPKKFAIGIFARANNRYRVLPLALQDLWRAGKVRDEDLPWLLNKIEQRLWRSDYPPSRLRPLMLAYAIMFGLFAAIGLGAYVLATRWNGPNPVSPSEAEVYLIALWAGVGTGLICLLSIAVYLWCGRRRQSQAKAWLSLLQARAAGLAA